MKKKITFLLMAVVFSIGSAIASDFTVLTTPRDVFEKSVELESGARAAFEAVLNNAAATAEEITAAMQTYMQKASPKAGYAFDMNFLLSYTHATEENKVQYTQAKLAEIWKCDVSGIVFGKNSSLMATSSEKAGVYMRVNDTENLKTEVSYGKFVAYQEVELGRGSYHLQARGYVGGLLKAATLSAGDLADSNPFLGGGVLADYSVDFKMSATENIKLGFKRNDAAGNLTQVAFNDMELYKVSGIVEIKDDATEALAPAENVDVQLCRDFKAGQYYSICLPFVVENWREVFEDLRLWNNYVDGVLQFETVKGADTQARKPYLVKFKTDIDESNWLVFKGVTVEKGNAGSWVRTSEENFPVKYQGNWAAGFVPENCYYLDGNEWKLSDGTVPQTAFSAYIDATGLADCPATMKMNAQSAYVRNVTAGDLGTICLPYAVAAGDFSGAEFYAIAGKVMQGEVAQSMKLEQVSELEAGVPYMFCATADQLVAVYSGESVAEEQNTHANGLVGSFAGQAVAPGMYLINSVNKIQKCGSGCSIGANRAYINLNEVSKATAEVTGNQRLIKFEGTTGIASAMADADGKVDVYTMSGVEMRHQVRVAEAVKGLPRGIYIVNGQKVIVK